MVRRIFFSMTLALSLFSSALAQTDSLIFNNGNYIIGDLKSMDLGVLTIETSYSDSDFKIEWSGVKELYTETTFLITLSDGKRFNGTINTISEGKLQIKTTIQETIEVKADDIVSLQSVDSGFWDRVYASIDWGFSLTKSQNLSQLSMRSTLGYLADRWSVDGSYNSYNSSQDDAEDIKRTDGGINFNYFLPSDWYIPISITFSSNSEQNLNLRSLAKIGIGNYLIQTNRSYFGISAGVTYNNEKYTDESNNKSSEEGYFGVEVNLFGLDDLSLVTKANAYPSFTESKRWRADFVFDAKYDLPMDFYVSAGVSMNYDNRPVEDAPELDYIFHSGFGWEW